ncbi:MAG: tetratricopeptide repeat protein [Phycisphaerae bacterium]|nr:tetratricopeptide repeat protein [Phycisphaerae bacterium]
MVSPSHGRHDGGHFPRPGYYCPPYHHHRPRHSFHFGFGFSFGRPDYYYPGYYYPDYYYPPVVAVPAYGFGFSTVETTIVEQPIYNTTVVQEPAYAETVTPGPIVGYTESAPMLTPDVQPAPATTVTPDVMVEPAPSQPKAAYDAPATMNVPTAAVVEAPAVSSQAPIAPSPEPAAISPAPAVEPAPAPQTNAQTIEGTEPAEAPDGLSEKFIEQMNAGGDAFARGAYDEARRAFVAAMVEMPNNIDPMLALALTHFATGEYELAAMLLQQVLPDHPEIAQSLFDLRTQYPDAETLAKQITALRSHIESHPSEIAPRVLLGFVEHFSGQREEARKTFEAVAAQAPDNAVAAVFLEPAAASAPTTQPVTSEPSTTPPATTRPA